MYFTYYDIDTNEGTKFQDSIKEFANKHPDGIVITNPPFSLFREFVEVLMECNLKFLIVGNKNAITYKEVFKYIKANRLWLGYTGVKNFKEPSGDIKTFGNVGWFTNLDVITREEEYPLSARYDKDLYPKYDNYYAINVDKVKEIPYDYEGYMGIPITFLDKYNPKQFEICGTTEVEGYRVGLDPSSTKKQAYIGNRAVFKRLLIKNLQVRKDEENDN
ncbi:adenine-specific methyltransferase EcoRI family protein [Mycoplasma corogypsi]|uniref:adenine-specific methyltransferase EcoRI family protein n=1 Tax=Mycoplasma corogypsi TaxID=2106 RepID=UPI003872D6BA